MSRGKVTFVLAIAAFACLLAPAFSVEEEDDPKPYGYKDDPKPSYKDDDPKPYGYKEDPKPNSYKEDPTPYSNKDDPKQYGYKDDDPKPYGYKDDPKTYSYKADDDKDDDKDDQEDWDKRGKHHRKEDKSDSDEHGKGKWDNAIRHTEYLMCKHCGENTALVNSVMLNTFNVVKVYGVSLDLALSITLHIVYFILLVLDKLCDQNFHSMVDGVGQLIRTALANPQLAKTIEKSGLKVLTLFRCATDRLHKSLIF